MTGRMAEPSARHLDCEEKMKAIKLALIGYGNVGKAFAKMLRLRSEYIAQNFDAKVDITAICTQSKGALMDNKGIDTEHLDDQIFDRKKSSAEIITKADYDILIELTPINIHTGMPAIDHIRGGLSRGKHVITANKGPIAWDYRELRDLAVAKDVCFCYEATVMDGIPVFNLAKETLKGCQITEIKGILNATTNYILDEMEKGVDYESAVKEGQRRGFVEADPTMDLDGWDAAAKLTALMNVLMDVEITPKDIVREGISAITSEQIDKAKKDGLKYKLLCHGRMDGGKPVGTVRPKLIGKDELLASINGTAACVTLTTDLMGDISIIEHIYEPEIDQTAYGVLSDLLTILAEINRNN